MSADGWVALLLAVVGLSSVYAIGRLERRRREKSAGATPMVERRVNAWGGEPKRYRQTQPGDPARLQLRPVPFKRLPKTGEKYTTVKQA